MTDASSVADYRAYVQGQIESLTEALTKVMFGDFSVVAETRKRDEAFGYLCVMINVAINAARNAHDDLRVANLELARANEQLRATIAEQKRAEEEVRRLNENLELVVDQRTAELREARRAAEQASEAKSEFLSSMSHELRTPLNSILGFAQLLQIDDLEAGQAENVEYVLRAGRHLLQLIDELLDVARIEDGRIALSIEPVRIEDVLIAALELVAPLAAPEGIRIWAERTHLRQHALADQQRLKQVVMNLLANAVKYNRRGGSVTVSCRLTRTGRIRIEIADTGPGIAPDLMDRLFVPFERLGAERTTIQGSGIGLSISKRLVELMGGAIGAESEVGQGSTFWVELDAAELDADEDPQETAESENLAPLPGGTGNGPTILYVEDNLSNLRLVERILERRPAARLVVAMQGELALDLAREHQPDLILLDVHLPDIDGDEVFRRLQADPRTRAIPVVAVSAEATPAKIDRFLAAGAQAYLTKPLDVTRLLELIDNIPGAAGLRTETAPEGPETSPLRAEAIGPLLGVHNTPPGGRLTDVVDLLITEAHARLTELRAAVDAADAPTVEQRVHALKGTSANLAARVLPELCNRLERQAAAGDLTGATELVDVIGVELDRVTDALQHTFPPAI